MDISVVVNTRNEQKNIQRCLESVATLADEIVVVDMQSTDDTVKIARQYTSRIFTHENTGYVEPARNFALAKATGDWILLLDADEVVPDTLVPKLINLAKNAIYTYYRIPRKNIIFGKWIRFSGWWPDYQIRFFRQGQVTWDNDIHSFPVTEGKGMDLPAEEKNALVHYHYETITQYIERLNRYTSQEAKQLIRDGYEFKWTDVIAKTSREFFNRFFGWQGYKDGLHGLVLSLLQAFSFLVVQLKVWESEQFKQLNTVAFIDQVKKEIDDNYSELQELYYQEVKENKTFIWQLIYKLKTFIN